jgi:hypothetical protein
MDTRKDLHEELNLRIQATQVEIVTMRILVETALFELRMHLAEVEAQAELGSRRRTGAGVGEAQPYKFTSAT